MIKELFNCEPHGRMTGDKRREQILRTAIDLFSRRGFSGTTTREIATAAGVSEAMVFRHFAKKSEIFDAILENKSCHDGMRYPWEENPVIQDAMKRKDDFSVFYNMALHSLTKQQSDKGFIRLLLFAALEDHELSDRFFNDFVARLYEFLGGYIKQRQKDGAVRDINPNIVVRSFLGMLLHHSMNNILWDKTRRLLDIPNEEAAKNFAEILLRGIVK